MPNWCSNYISVRGTNSAEVKRLADAFDAGELCQAVIPVPEILRDTTAPTQPDDAAAAEQRQAETGYDNWYDFCVNRWGTKWDISIGDVCERDEDGLGFNGGFDSAWSPPMGVVEQLAEQGYQVTLYYNESGMAYVGKFEDGEDFCYDYGSCNSETVRGYIGDELDDFFGISEQMAEYEAENEEEELTEWLKDGIEQKKALVAL
jgi:hypothetical protein